MVKYHQNWPVAGIFAAVSLCILTLTSAVWINLDKLQEEGRWRAHTYDVLDAVKETDLALLAEASASRGGGRLISGSVSEQGRTNLLLGKLRSLTADNAQQQTRLGLIEASLRSWRLGSSAVKQPNATAGSPIQRLLNEFEAAERNLLIERSAQLHNAYIVTRSELISGAVIGIITVAAACLWALVVLSNFRRATKNLNDISERLHHLGRLNSLGEMAGALTHELNQPLSAALNYLGAARRWLDEDPTPNVRLQSLLEKAANQTIRAGQIIERTRSFVAKGTSQPKPEPLHQLIEEAAQLALASSGNVVDPIRFDFAPGSTHVNADRLHVQQVLVNLLRNAIEAMSTCPRRQLHIRTQADEGGMVRISIDDTGPGIHPEVAERLFQPFATTKPEGMGIGLSICRNIIESHGGRIWAESNPNGGASFQFTLQRAH